MKRYLTFISIIISIHASAQSISLKECIESGLVNKANIQSSKIETIIANLKSIETKSKFLPQLNIAYDYRYNPVIPSQIVPIGQFSTMPNDEKRAIQFGTRWQQNAGVTIYQPLVDKVIKSRISENKLNEKIAGIELQQVENNLIYEIIKSYSRILVVQKNIEEKTIDTARSFLTYTLIKIKWEEGKILKTELNEAQINHLANILNYKKGIADLIDEKIYLHFLTGIQLEKILEGKLNPIPDAVYQLAENNITVQTDSLTEFKTLSIRENLLRQQIMTEKTKYIPVLGAEGFLGANQFSNKFNPAMNNSWFGNSYIGLSIKLPLFTPTQSINAQKQLQQRIKNMSYQKSELKSEIMKQFLQLKNKIDQYKNEQEYLENSLALKKENISAYQYQLENGRFTSIDINIKETDVQNLSSQLINLKEKLNQAIIEQLKICGYLNKTLFNLLK